MRNKNNCHAFVGSEKGTMPYFVQRSCDLPLQTLDSTWACGDGLQLLRLQPPNKPGEITKKKGPLSEFNLFGHKSVAPPYVCVLDLHFKMDSSQKCWSMAKSSVATTATLPHNAKKAAPIPRIIQNTTRILFFDKPFVHVSTQPIGEHRGSCRKGKKSPPKRKQ